MHHKVVANMTNDGQIPQHPPEVLCMQCSSLRGSHLPLAGNAPLCGTPEAGLQEGLCTCTACLPHRLTGLHLLLLRCDVGCPSRIIYWNSSTCLGEAMRDGIEIFGCRECWDRIDG